MERPLRARRLMRAASLVGIVAAVALALVPAASESSVQNRLFAYVVATNRGPMPACIQIGVDCTDANAVRHFIYVVNANRLTNVGGTRATLENAFVVSGVDSTIFVDGAETFQVPRQIPPPNAFFGGGSGNWPSTVTCPSVGLPCNVVSSPAVDPGENTAIFHATWFHGNTEPNGTYVFRFTVHGTLNGTPIDLTASGPPIVMTD